MNDRFRNLDFDVPKLPNRKPRKPEPKEPEAMTFGGMTIRKDEYVPMGVSVSWTDTSAANYTLQSIAAMRAEAWNNVVTQQFITGESWKKI